MLISQIFNLKTIWNIYYWLEYYTGDVVVFRFICFMFSCLICGILSCIKEFKIMFIFLLFVLILCLLPKLFYNVVTFCIKHILKIKPGTLYKINKNNVLYENDTNIKVSLNEDTNVLILEKFNLNQKFIYKDLYCRPYMKGKIKVLYGHKIYQVNIKCLLNL